MSSDGRRPGTAADPAASAAGAMAGIWQAFRQTLQDQMSVIDRAATGALSGSLDSDLRDGARGEAHKLAGSLGTFGIARGTELAREIEAWMQPGGLTDPAAVLKLSDAVVELRACVEAGPASNERVASGESAPIQPGRPFVLLVDDDPVLVNGLRREVSQSELGLEVVPDPRAALQFAGPRPEVVLVGAAGPRMGDAFTLMERLASQSPPVPVIVLTAADSFIDRVEAARLGAKRFLRRPANPREILATIQDVIEAARVDADTILVVDDDASMLAALAALLEPYGMRIVALQDPLEFWDVLKRTSPDLVVLDVGLPEVSGVELCRVLRADSRWSHIPVMFLSASTGPETVRSIFEAGADDYLSKPLVGPELTSRVLNRLERSKLNRRLIEVDPLTGVANQQTSSARMEKFLAAAKRGEEPVTIADVDVDGLRALNDRAGYPVGDQVLRWLGQLLKHSFSAEDVVGRWAGQEFVIGMFGMNRAEGIERLATVLEELRQRRFDDDQGNGVSMSFSAGVAQYPQDGGDLRTLQRACRAALRCAKEAGGDRVVPAGWSLRDGSTVDVVVVEDDDALAGILQHGLSTRAYRTVRFADGEDAVGALEGPNPKTSGRVILLDWGLPSLDGLAVLRRLAGSGVLDRSRVIMLTARDSETEVLQALDLGAYDHVAKPFSVPVLMKRIHRAMER